MSKLQSKLGCFDPVEDPIFEAAGFDYVRCPVTYRLPEAHQMFTLHKEGALTASFETRMSWPPKRLAALFYLKYLQDLKETRGN